MSSATMSVKETTSVKLDRLEKEKAKIIFRQLGLTLGDAFNIFLRQVNLEHGIPFPLKVPNPELQLAIEEADKGINVEPFSISELEQMRDEQANSNTA